MAMVKSDKKRIVLKIGSATLTRGSDTISRGKLEDIARQIKILNDQYEFIIVCSGAIVAARQYVNLEGRGKEIGKKQALAAIGQPYLMHMIQETFRELRLYVGQCLLSYMDFEIEKARDNIRNTIQVLLSNNYIPIINENDTVAIDEIQFGDNDKLAALTSVIVDADLLIMATNTYGIYDQNGSTILRVNDISDIRRFIKNETSVHGTGGMNTKLIAAEIAKNNNIETWLVNGHGDRFILDAIEEKNQFTKILVSG